MTRRATLAAAVLALGALMGGASGCAERATTVELTGWKLTLPETNDKGRARELKEARAAEPWLTVTEDGSLEFWAPTTGGATTAHSSHPRTELISLTEFRAGLDPQVLRSSVTVRQVPRDGNGIIVGQIHGGGVLKSVAFVMLRWKDDALILDVKQGAGPERTIYRLLGDVPLNNRFDYSLADRGNGEIVVTARHGGRSGEVRARVPAAFTGQTVRFQAGDYQQADRPEGDDDGGRVIFHQLSTAAGQPGGPPGVPTPGMRTSVNPAQLPLAARPGPPTQAASTARAPADPRGTPIPVSPMPSGGRPPVAVGARPPSPPADPAPSCRPSEILDLSDWKLSLPLARPDGDDGSVAVAQPELAVYRQEEYFLDDGACAGVAFRAPVTGATASGSKSSRTELREMTPGGNDQAAWSSGAGTHRMTVVEAFTRLPESDDPEVIGARIHADDQVTALRLEGSRLWITNGDDNHHKLITDDYRLGTRFELTYEVGDGKVRVLYNGEPQTVLPGRFRDAYFKVGAYTQVDCATATRCSVDNYGETTVYDLRVTHQVTTGQVLRDLLVTYLPPVLLGLVVLGLITHLLVHRIIPTPRRKTRTIL